MKTSAPEPDEAAVQAALMRNLCAAGWLVVRINGSSFKDSRGQLVRSYIIQRLKVSSGFPDVLALRGNPRGYIEAHLFEIKKLGGTLSDSQKRFINFAARYGVGVIIVEGWASMERVSARFAR